MKKIKPVLDFKNLISLASNEIDRRVLMAYHPDRVEIINICNDLSRFENLILKEIDKRDWKEEYTENLLKLMNFEIDFKKIPEKHNLYYPLTLQMVFDTIHCELKIKVIAALVTFYELGK